ncbi:unnamed protein product [Caenorhabditis auriculariae]|uniref:G-protein coupled receptors family 1 profile domain-containing protein n=1 Tax=Caenorhabditis auriculariae TaxID=2777116 RepID=A0A8S1HMM6_9PELO|nr:unnamed protein product [Caenorhabditis auriculariae]
MNSSLTTFVITVLFCNVFGNFGNFHIVYLTATKPDLRSKSAFLQCIVSACHSICLIFQIPNAVLYLNDIQITRRQCFFMISPFLISLNFQCIVMLMMLVDIAAMIIFPFRYRKLSNTTFLTTASIAPAAFTIYFYTIGFLAIDDEVLPFCTGPFAMHPTVNKIWLPSLLTVNTMIVVLYFFVFALLYHVGKKQTLQKECRRVSRRLKVILFIYMVSWYLSIFGATFLALFFEGRVLDFLRVNMAFFMELCFLQSFYVIMWRSKEYRLAFFSLYPCFDMNYFSPESTSRVIESNKQTTTNQVFLPRNTVGPTIIR